MNTLALVKVAKLVCGGRVTTIRCPQLTGFEKESVAMEIAAQYVRSQMPEFNQFDVTPTIRFDWEPQANMLLN